MKILHWGRADPEAVDQYLQEERLKRIANPQKFWKDFAIVYEPLEAFSIQKEKDLEGIRPERAEEFWKHVDTHNIPLIMTKRGGGIIWHGPGQVCLDPLVNIRRLGINVSEYSNVLEETCLRTLARFGVRACRNHYRAGSQGAWVVDEDGTKKKIAFFGWSESRGIAIHGCAINVSCPLRPFSFIDPCNLPNVEATSMKEVLGRHPSAEEVGRVLAEIFAETLYAGIDSTRESKRSE